MRSALAIIFAPLVLVLFVLIGLPIVLVQAINSEPAP